MKAKVKEKEIHTKFQIIRSVGNGRVYGYHDFRTASVHRGGRFMDFTKTGTVISMN